eukprot:TRINITY_DN4091_c0_g1_i1.p1 TRINITY_DN4091_c0_g1~~TRINITY_DN4091_c0_g1_i1.p1  ORF type:complete len:351 (+),score=186.82 TRINITY_DN4091_c0_g1_i1:51-1055(+)
MSEAKRVLVTGAAGQISYSLIFLITRGELFGPDQPIILHLLDVPFCVNGLNGVVMEIQDCASPVIQEVVATTDVEVAFKDIDVAILVGAFPRKDGMERKDLLAKNASIFKEQGQALNRLAKKDVKVLVVGNPANTNAAIASHFAPDISPKNFSCLTRLDHNRAVYQLAHKAGVAVNSIENVTIWGNHSSTQFPDYHNATTTLADGSKKPITDLIADQDWLTGSFLKTVQTRGAEIIKARTFSSAASAAKAIIDHLRDWIFGTTGSWVSMGIVSDGSYGIPAGVVYSFPVRARNGEYEIVQGLEINAFQREKMDLTLHELQDEFHTAMSLFGESS